MNCDIVGRKETKEAGFIDPGGDVPKIRSEPQGDLKVKYILNTHGDWDHTDGNDEVKRITEACRSTPPTREVERGEGRVSRGRQEIWSEPIARVHHTPGHSPGGDASTARGAVFSGDTFSPAPSENLTPGGSDEDLLNGV